MKKYFSLIGIAVFAVLLLASCIIQDTLGNNYRDIYDPFWISVSSYLLLGAYVWAIIVLFITLICEKE